MSAKVQVGQVPTAQGISALLRKAGFNRSKPSGRWHSPGYRVHRDFTDHTVVCVEYVAGSGGESREHRIAWAARYAEAIRAAGWHVIDPEPDMWARLTVLPRPVPGDNSSKEG